MAYVVMADTVLACIFMACIFMAYILIACIFMACVFMAGVYQWRRLGFVVVSLGRAGPGAEACAWVCTYTCMQTSV